MAVTAATFILEYTEFQPLHAEDNDLVERVCARADRRTSVDWPEATRDDAVMLRAAHMLALTPMGRNAKLSEPGKPTAYQQELDCMIKAFACARSRIV